MIFTHTPPINELPPLKAKNINGKRFYEHLETKEAYPSITSVLSIRDKKGLHEWRQKVGEEVEDYLNNIDLEQVDKYKKQFLPRMMFNVLKPELSKINNIRLQEAQMFSSDYTVAGRVDCIAEYDGVLSIVDFKTSTKEKNESWIENYFIQGSAYAEMFKEHFGEEVTQVVILIVTEEGTTQVFKKNKVDYLPKLKEAVENFYKWIEREKNEK
jgi:ATP-dependent exoDNAse (exonuclease V) beta subunit